MPEFSLPLPLRDQAWIDLRARLAHVARDLHFVAVSKDVVNGAALLAVAGDLARLALSIPSYRESGTRDDWPARRVLPILERDRRVDAQAPARASTFS